MIVICPYCGAFLNSFLLNGIELCSHCNRVVETTDYNELLSSARYVRKFHIYDIERIRSELNLSDKVAEALNQYIIEEDYNFEQIPKI